MLALILGVLCVVLGLHALGGRLKAVRLEEENDRLWREVRAAQHEAQWVRWLLERRDRGGSEWSEDYSGDCG